MEGGGPGGRMASHPGVAVLQQLVDGDISAQHLQVCFGSFDTNHDGKITREELRLGLNAMALKHGMSITEEIVDDVMEATDPEHDGQIDPAGLVALAHVMVELRELRAQVHGDATLEPVPAWDALTLRVVTYNVGECNPANIPATKASRLLLGEPGSPRPSIIAFCGQEVEMSSGAFAGALVYAGSLTEQGQAWQTMLNQTLGTVTAGRYMPVIPCTQMMGVFLAIYALPHVAQGVAEVDVKQVETGLGLGTGVHQLSKKGAGTGKMIEKTLHLQDGALHGLSHFATQTLHEIEKVAHDFTPAGGNKGAIGARFVIRPPPPPPPAGVAATVVQKQPDGLSVAVIAAHLAAGQHEQAKRNADVTDILSRLQWDVPDGTVGIESCCSLVFAGDLNYRIDGDTAAVKDAIERLPPADAIIQLIKQDQLTKEVRAGRVMRGMREAEPITFPPTYKYDVDVQKMYGIGFDRYDTSKKKRAPSWCDRIFTRGIGLEAVPWSYGCLQDLRLSDHRPVFAVLRLPDPTVDHAPAMLARLMYVPPPTPDMQWPAVIVAEEDATIPEQEISAAEVLEHFASGRISESSGLWAVCVNRWCTVTEIIATSPLLLPIFGDGTKSSGQIIGYAKAMYTYTPPEDAKDTDCAFSKGDILVILKEEAGGWLMGYIGAFGAGGLNIDSRQHAARTIPGNYVQAISPFRNDGKGQASGSS